MALSAAVFEALTDKAVAYLQAMEDAVSDAVLKSTSTRAAGWSNGTLFDIIDATEDPDLEIYLGSASNRLDGMWFPENWATHIYPDGDSQATDSSPGVLGLMGCNAAKGMYQALDTYVKSDAGGGYDNLAAYLLDVTAYVLPLFAEVGYKQSGTAFQNSSSEAPNVYSPAYDVIAPTSFYVGTPGSWTDDLADAVDPGAGDVNILASDNDIVATGGDRRFSMLAVQLGTLASVDCTLEFYYSAGGSNYRQLTTTLTDGTVGMTKSNVIYFTIPDDWVKTNLDSGGNFYAATDKTPRYYFLIKRTANTVVTPPVLTQVNLVPEPVYIGSRFYGGAVQPPLAIVAITNTNTISVITGSTVSAEHAKFQAPSKLQLKPLCIQGSPTTVTALTVSYTDQDGTSATKAQTITWTPVLGTNEPSGTSYVALDTGDTGVRSIRTTGWTTTTANTNVVFAVVNVLPRTAAL